MMTPTIHSARLDLIPMTPAVLRALLDGDYDAAGRLLGVSWPVDCEVHRDVLELRLGQLEAVPGMQPWLMRAIVLREEGVAVGHIGFHSAPGHESLEELSPGAVEFGYEIMAAYRRRGLVSEAMEALIDWARDEHGVTRFVVSISPENVASRGLAARLGFQKIGWHMDEEDGPEEIFERVERSEMIFNRW